LKDNQGCLGRSPWRSRAEQTPQLEVREQASRQTERPGLLPQLGAHPRMGRALDQATRLFLLVTAEEWGDALLRDDGCRLERGDRLVHHRHDRRDVGPGVPGPQRDEGLTTGGVQGTDDEVGLAAEAAVDARVYAGGVGLPEE